jgi:hypothetical protein
MAAVYGRERGREIEGMDGYICVVPSHKILVVKMMPKHSKYDH